MPLSPIRLQRLNAGLTLHDVQQLTGIQASRLSLAERGLIELSDDQKHDLALALAAPIHELFPSTSEANAS